MWAPLDRSPYFEAQFRAIEEILGPQATASFLDAFACSADQVTTAFRTAGMHHVTAGEVRVDIDLPGAAEFVRAHLSAIPWGIAVAEARPDGMERATASIVERLATFIDAGGTLTVPCASVLVAGRR